MSMMRTRVGWLLLFGTMTMAGAAPRAQQDGEGGTRPADEDGDRTLSPYYFVGGGDPAVDRLPLKEPSADIQIAGVAARLRVHQIFHNSADKPIQPAYAF